MGTGLSLGEIDGVLGTHMNKPDLGSLCTSNSINAWAKYKPFRNSALYFASASDWSTAMEASGCGFGNLADANITIYNSSQDGPDKGVRFYFDSSSPFWTPEWAPKYKKPRGVGVVNGVSVNEPYRQLDFADLTASSTYGYNSEAKPPVEISFPESIRQTGSTITVKTNGSVSGGFDVNTNLTTNNLFASLDPGKNYYLGILFRCSSFPSFSSYADLLVTDHIVTSANKDFGGTNTATIKVSGDPTDSSAYYVPLFRTPVGSDSGFAIDGDDIYCTACLVEYGQGASDQPTDATRNIIGDNIPQGHASVSLNLASRVVGNTTLGIDKAILSYRTRTSVVGLDMDIYSGPSGQSAWTSVSRQGSFTENNETFTILRLDSIGLKLNSLSGTELITNDNVNYKLFIKVSDSVNANTMVDWTLASDANHNGYTEYQPQTGHYTESTPPVPIMDGNQDIIRSFRVPSTIPNDFLGPVMSWYSSGTGKIYLPYIYVKQGYQSAVKVIVSGYAFTGDDTRPGTRQAFDPLEFIVNL